MAPSETDTTKQFASKYFNDPSAKVVFTTSDGGIFRVDDFYLKASRRVCSEVSLVS